MYSRNRSGSNVNFFDTLQVTEVKFDVDLAI